MVLCCLSAEFLLASLGSSETRASCATTVRPRTEPHHCFALTFKAERFALLPEPVSIESAMDIVNHRMVKRGSGSEYIPYAFNNANLLIEY